MRKGGDLVRLMPLIEANTYSRLTALLPTLTHYTILPYFLMMLAGLKNSLFKYISSPAGSHETRKVLFR